MPYNFFQTYFFHFLSISGKCSIKIIIFLIDNQPLEDVDNFTKLSRYFLMWVGNSFQLTQKEKWLCYKFCIWVGQIYVYVDDIYC